MDSTRTPGVRTGIAGTLAACGGSDDGAAASGGQNPPSPSTQTPATASKKVLLVGVDGATYSALQSALLAHALPNLGQLTLMPSATGGTLGTVTEQAPLDAPSWATVLSGTGATAMASPTTAPASCRRRRCSPGCAAPPAARAGAATSSMVMPGLLVRPCQRRAEHPVDCAGADDCVTQNSLRPVRAGYDTVFAHYTAPPPPRPRQASKAAPTRAPRSVSTPRSASCWLPSPSAARPTPARTGWYWSRPATALTPPAPPPRCRCWRTAPPSSRSTRRSMQT